MVTFLSILLVLLGINAALLLFSVNGALAGFKKTLKRISDKEVIQLPSAEFSDTKYKKAV